MTKTALITNVTHFLGRPVLRSLASTRPDVDVVAHDVSFESSASKIAFLDSLDHDTSRITCVGSASPSEVVADAVRLNGSLDYVVHNDAHPAIRNPIQDVSAQELSECLNSLVVFPFLLSGEIVKLWRANPAESGSRRMVFCTSSSYFKGIPNFSAYVTARGAAAALAKNLSKELLDVDVRVNAIAPNFIESETYFPKKLMDVHGDKIRSNVPLNRLGTPKEAGDVVAFFLHPSSDFLTGQIIQCDGGCSAL